MVTDPTCTAKGCPKAKQPPKMQAERKIKPRPEGNNRNYVCVYVCVRVCGVCVFECVCLCGRVCGMMNCSALTHMLGCQSKLLRKSLSSCHFQNPDTLFQGFIKVGGIRKGWAVYEEWGRVQLSAKEL